MYTIKQTNQSETKGRFNATLKVLSFKNQKQKTYDDASLQQMIRENQYMINSLQHNSNMAASTSTNITTNNTFNNLVDDDGNGIEFDLDSEIHSKNKNNKIIITPIIIQNITENKLRDILKELNINKFLIKLCSIGIKISLHNQLDYNNLRKHLTDTNTEHFTYRSPSEKILKVILNGLPKKINTDEIKQVLTDNEYTNKDINSDDIIEITELNPKEGLMQNGLYLIKFNANNIKFRIIQKIKSLNHIIVSFRIHTPRKISPTQCRRCGMYGHGTSYCYKILRCLKCGDPHDTLQCKVSDVNLKCCLCQGNHMANSPNCPKLKEYILIQENVKIKRNIKSNNINNIRGSSIRPPPNLLNAEKFPELSSPRPTQMHQAWNSIFNNKPTNSNYSVNQNKLDAANVSRQVNSTKDSLFTYEEILTLVSDMVSSLSVCKTKAEQFTVLTRLTVTYLYNNVK